MDFQMKKHSFTLLVKIRKFTVPKFTYAFFKNQVLWRRGKFYSILWVSANTSTYKGTRTFYVQSLLPPRCFKEHEVFMPYRRIALLPFIMQKIWYILFIYESILRYLLNNSFIKNTEHKNEINLFIHSYTVLSLIQAPRVLAKFKW